MMKKLTLITFCSLMCLWWTFPQFGLADDSEQINTEQRRESQERWQNMTPEQREEMRQRWQNMTPEQRREFRERRQKRHENRFDRKG
ncbi:MAG: DUF3106 domain-containing protein, partial [Anaerolineales bacterium]|nr:DUF3106 domain-containing protein [Anaerolineales bacterium]